MNITLDNREIKNPKGLDGKFLQSRTSFFVVQVFHYKKQYAGIPTFGESTTTKGMDGGQKLNLTSQQFGLNTEASIHLMKDSLWDTDNYIIVDEILSVSINKSIGQKGSINISLATQVNWKAKLAPGDWFIVYVFNTEKNITTQILEESKDKIVFIGNIDRVARQIAKDDDDKTTLRYQIAGSNFVKVFEKTDIWFNPYANQEKVVDIAMNEAGLALFGSPNELISRALKIFLGPGDTIGDYVSPPLNQWKMPPALMSMWPDLGTTFYDLLDQSIADDLPGNAIRQMLTLDSNGSLLDLLGRWSNPLVNELFFDECRGGAGGQEVRPTIKLRPRPLNTEFIKEHFVKNDRAWKVVENNYQTIFEHSYLHSLEISEIEIKYQDLGHDDHSRFNMIWLKSQDASNGMNSMGTANMGTRGVGLGLPTFNEPSINRYGLNRLDQQLEFFFEEASGPYANVSNLNLVKAFIGQLYDFHYCNHMYETGTIETTGVMEAELGRSLKIKHTEGPDKIYYIEGYSHNYTYPSHWTTTFTVTHGQWDSATLPFIDFSKDDRGQEDVYFKNSYYGKTFIKKG